jgi:hypothetical protein
MFSVGNDVGVRKIMYSPSNILTKRTELQPVIFSKLKRKKPKSFTQAHLYSYHIALHLKRVGGVSWTNDVTYTKHVTFFSSKVTKFNDLYYQVMKEIKILGTCTSSIEIQYSENQESLLSKTSARI